VKNSGARAPGCAPPASSHVHDAPLMASSTHMTLEDTQGESEALSEGLRDVHFATLEEKKRLWLRDALINTLFIASWYVGSILNGLPVTPMLSHTTGSFLLYCCRCITNGCSRPNTLDSHSRSSSRCYTCSFRPFWRPFCALAGHAGSVRSMTHQKKSTCEHLFLPLHFPISDSWSASGGLSTNAGIELYDTSSRETHILTLTSLMPSERGPSRRPSVPASMLAYRTYLSKRLPSLSTVSITPYAPTPAILVDSADDPPPPNPPFKECVTSPPLIFS